MKKTTKRLLAGILAGTMALSLTATVGADQSLFKLGKLTSAVEQAVVPVDFVEEQKVETLSVQQVRSAYFSFYQTYGAEKAADVFYNGQALNFVDAFPLIQDGTTFVPLAVFADAIGAETSYIAETHSVSLLYKGNTITFDIDDTAFYVNGGAAQELPYATFVASERTMVPVRFITDAFELDLYWNGTMKQVIAADLEALKTGDYALLEGLLAMTSGQEEGKNTKVSGDLDYVVSMNGKSVEISGDIEALANEDLSAVNYNMGFTTDLSDFQSDIEAMLAALSVYPEDEAAVNTLIQGVEQFELNYMYDIQNLEFYLQSDLIHSALPIFTVGGTGVSLPVTADTWYKLDISDFMLASEIEAFRAVMSQVSATEAMTTVDALVDGVMELTRSCDNQSVNVYGSLALLLATCKDDQFVVSGNDYTKNVYLSDGSQKMSIKLLVNTDGSKNVTGYTLTGTFEDGAEEGLEVEVSQSSREAFQITMNMRSGEVVVTCTGDFAVSYVNEVATGSPNSSDVYDLTKLF